MAEVKIEAVQLSLPSILDGKFFTVMNQTDKKVSVKCMLCPNKSLSARTDATSKESPWIHWITRVLSSILSSICFWVN